MYVLRCTRSHNKFPDEELLAAIKKFTDAAEPVRAAEKRSSEQAKPKGKAKGKAKAKASA